MGSLVPPAPPWALLILVPQRISRPPAAPQPFTPSAPPGSSFPSSLTPLCQATIFASVAQPGGVPFRSVTLRWAVVLTHLQGLHCRLLRLRWLAPGSGQETYQGSALASVSAAMVFTLTDSSCFVSHACPSSSSEIHSLPPSIHP